MDAKNVSAAKPKIGGSVFVAPLGTKLPEDAKSELDTKFNSHLKQILKKHGVELLF